MTELVFKSNTTNLFMYSIIKQMFSEGRIMK